MTPLLFVAVFLAFVAEATAGFGATVITVTLLAHIQPVHATLAVFLPVNMVLSAYLSVRYWDSMDRVVLGRQILPTMGLGLLGGLALFGLRDLLAIKLLFGCVVVGLALLELWGRGRAPQALSPWRARAALLGAGLIHGLYSCGGPLVVYVLGRDVQDKGRFRATLSGLWLTMNCVLTTVYAANGEITPATLRTSALLVIPLVLGGWVGERLHARVPVARFRTGVFALLGFAGLSLAVRTGLEMWG